MAAVREVNANRTSGVRGQLVRATTTVPANIAEAAIVGTDRNFRRQLRRSLASAKESGSHWHRLKRAGALARHSADARLNKRTVVCRMRSRLIRAIDEREASHEDGDRNE